MNSRGVRGARRVSPVLVSLFVLVPLAVARAQPAPSGETREAARHLVDGGLAAQGRGDYDTAITLYTKAYELVPHPVLLFDIAQAHRLAGRIEQAVAYYRKFLATSPTGTEARTARDVLDELVPPAPAPAPMADTPPSPGSAGRRLQRPSRPPAPWYSDKVGDGLVIGGAAATIAGVLMIVSARSDDDAAKAVTASYAEAMDLRESARHKGNASLVLLGAGVSLVASGVARYIVHDRAADLDGVGVAPSSHGGMVTYRATF